MIKEFSLVPLAPTCGIERPTFVIELEACPDGSAGVLYQKCQEKSTSSLPPEIVISTKRGTGRMKVSEYPKVESKTPNWGFITSARGTTSSRL